jgi:hypothetical protein
MRLLFVLLLLDFQSLAAQSTASVGVSISLPSVALLDIEPNNTGISLSLTAPTESGNAATLPATNSTKWLNFTSAVATGTTRRITAQLSGTLPTGINLRLNTAAYAGNGAGTLGSRVPTIYLSSSPQTIVSSIGGAFTGNGSGNGYNLSFALEIANYANLRNQTGTVSIIYTLIDN